MAGSPEPSPRRGFAAHTLLSWTTRVVGSRLRRLGLVWLILLPILGLAAATLAMQALGIVSWDAPAHLYKVALLRQYKAVFWDNDWYGGAYQIVSYGFVFYWLAQFVSYNVLVVVSTGALPVLYYLYMRRAYGSTSYWPAIALAAVLVIYLSNGQDPFLFALSFTFGAMVLLAYGRPMLATLPAAVALFANPLAIVVGAVFLLAAFAAQPEVRRRYLWFALWLVPFLAVRVLIGILFYEKGTYMYPTAEIIHFVGFGACGYFLARMSFDPARRAKQTLFLTFAVVAVAVALVPGNPVGWNVGRFFFIFGVPLLLDVRRVYLRKAFTSVMIVGFALGQLTSPFSHFFRVHDMPSTTAAFFAPALDFAAAHDDPNYRFHVVALDTHWEAYYFSINGYPITRGWYRQSDALHNQVLSGEFDEAAYVAWLKDMGVKYVFLPNAPLDWSGGREAGILRSSAQFTVVYESPQWTIFRLHDPEPLVVSLDGGRPADVLLLEHQSLYMHVPAAGRYLVKVSYSPYWEMRAGAATLSRGADDFLVLDASAPGYYGIWVNVSLQSSWRELIRVF